MHVTERPSGLIVPAHLEHAPDVTRDLSDSTPRDPDGRRRILLDASTRRLMRRLLLDVTPADVAFLFVCRTTRLVRRAVVDPATDARRTVVVDEPIPGACGQIMIRCGDGTPDVGFECECSRIHFLEERQGPQRH